MDTFQKFPHFIDTDIRISRSSPFGYNVNYNLMKYRHQVLLPPDLVENRSILDLGCCVGATGAWALDNGALTYTGVELQKNFANQAKENLSQSFAKDKWKIIESSFEDFFKHNIENYDIVYAGGILYSSLYYQELLKHVTDIANVAVVVESRIPNIIIPYLKEDPAVEFLPVVEYETASMVHENSANLKVKSAVPNLGAVSMLLEDQGFSINLESYNKYKHLKTEGPERFGCIFYKDTNLVKSQTTENLYKNNSGEIVPWSTPIPTQWEFNEDVAKGFVQHAKMHIPNYSGTIDLSVNLCKTLLNDPMNARIIDVGCATGETISKLYANGCCNLVGVDNSQAMLDQCPVDYAYYILNNEFPLDAGPYDAVICNWTLHFIKDKIRYLEQIYKGLNSGGFIVLTDKTENSGTALKLYHNFKRQQGLSEEEIEAKNQSVRNIMFIDPPTWYLDTLSSVGFSDVSIISSAPCFTTFIAVK